MLLRWKLLENWPKLRLIGVRRPPYHFGRRTSGGGSKCAKSAYIYTCPFWHLTAHTKWYFCVCNNTIIRSKNIFISFLFVLIHSIIIKQGVINVRQYSIFAGLFFKINQKMSACTMTKWPPIAFRNEVTPLGVSEVSTILFLERRLFLRTLIEHITAAPWSMQKCTGHFGLYSLGVLYYIQQQWASRSGLQ